MGRQVQLALGVGLFLILIGALGAVTDIHYENSRIGASVGSTYQSEWTAVATLSGCNGDPAVGSRNYDDLAAIADTSVAIWTVPFGTNAASFRFHIDADANTATVRAGTCRTRYNPGDAADDFNVQWQWAITGGTQTDADGAVYADTSTTAEYSVSAGAQAQNPENWIYEYAADLRGARYVAFWRTDSDANLTVTVDAAVY